MSMTVTIENVGDGTLITLASGGTIWFDSRVDAAAFGRKLMMVAALGGDTLDGAPVVDAADGQGPA